MRKRKLIPSKLYCIRAYIRQQRVQHTERIIYTLYSVYAYIRFLCIYFIVYFIYFFIVFYRCSTLSIARWPFFELQNASKIPVTRRDVSAAVGTRNDDRKKKKMVKTATLESSLALRAAVL